MDRFFVILGRHINDDGTPCEETIQRIEYMVSFLTLKPAERVIACGWAYRKDLDISLAEAMRKYIRERYPLLDDIVICQDLSRDTVGDAVFTRFLLGKRIERSASIISVITSDYHVERTAAIFRFVFGENVRHEIAGCPTDKTDLYRDKETRSHSVFREMFKEVPPAKISAILDKMRTTHPYYNGFVHPKIVQEEEIVRALRWS